MENATRALLIAGGILIAIIIITLLVRTYGSIGRFQKQQLTAEEAERIEAFNKQYIKYQGQYVYGTEVISVVNSIKNSKATEYIDMETKIRYTDGKEVLIKKDSSISINYNNIKTKVFKCTKIEYDNSTGKVKGISFEEKSIS